MAKEPETEISLSVEPPEPESDIQALTTAIVTVAENTLRKLVGDAVPPLIKPHIEQSLKSMVPGLIENAVAEEKVLIKETAQELARQALPGLLAPIIERMAKDLLLEEVHKFVSGTAKDIIHEEARKLVSETAKEIIEKVVWDVVPSQAEAEVKKELERLSVET